MNDIYSGFRSRRVNFSRDGTLFPADEVLAGSGDLDRPRTDRHGVDVRIVAGASRHRACAAGAVARGGWPGLRGGMA